MSFLFDRWDARIAPSSKKVTLKSIASLQARIIYNKLWALIKIHWLFCYCGGEWRQSNLILSRLFALAHWREFQFLFWFCIEVLKLMLIEKEETPFPLLRDEWWWPFPLVGRLIYFLLYSRWKPHTGRWGVMRCLTIGGVINLSVRVCKSLVRLCKLSRDWAGGIKASGSQRDGRAVVLLFLPGFYQLRFGSSAVTRWSIRGAVGVGGSGSCW